MDGDRQTSDKPTGKRGGWRGNPKSLANLTGPRKLPSLEELGPEAADPDLLAAMVWVQSHPKSQDRTELHKDCRRWKAKNLAAFMAKRADLEKLRAPEEKEKGEAAVDEGEERCLGLLRDLLERKQTEGV